mmetsp:Transcript_7209/g.8218  ORF Transcript_7209/g.8218 Transcript_7209/m.8218 type:complete len:550 (-) Transcript_7209:55-1704(-)
MLAIFLPLLLLLLSCCYGQESPSIPPYTKGDDFQLDPNANYRQDLCPAYEKVKMGNASLPEALRGVALRPVLLINKYFNFDKEKGIIPEKNPGLKVELLDKICERAGCTWRDSYGVIEKPENKTFDELLHWSIETYDISIAWWAESLERKERDVGFMKPWYDADIVMVTKKERKLNLLSWMEPFHKNVWIAIALTIVSSGVVYWILKLLDPDTDESKVKKNPSSSIFLASIAFTSQFDFHPLTHAGRIFAFSLSLWSLLITNSYVANLTSFLIVEHQQEYTMNFIVENNRPVCVRNTSQQDTAMQKLYPTMLRVPKNNILQVYQGVLDGDCTIGITTFSDWDESKNREINTNCNLEIVGPVIERHDGGFATLADTGDKCTSLIRDVLGYHLSHIENDNPAEKFRTNAWERHIELRKDQDCTGNIEEDIGNRLKFTHVSSIFFFHGVLTAFALCLALLIWRLRKRETRNKNTNQHSNLRKTLQGKEKGVLQRSLETSFAMSNNISDATKEEDRIIIDQMRNIVKEEVKEHVQDLDTKVSEVLRLLRIFIT